VCHVSLAYAGAYDAPTSDIDPTPGWTTEVQIFSGRDASARVIGANIGPDFSIINGVWTSTVFPLYIDGTPNPPMVPLGAAGNVWAMTASVLQASWVHCQAYGPIKRGSFLEFDYAVYDEATAQGATSFSEVSIVSIESDGDPVQNQQVWCYCIVYLARSQGVSGRCACGTQS
jgi:hypothetical protein